MLKRLIFATFAGLSGFGALFSLWGALYWRSQSMRQLPRTEIDEALYDYHAWLFYLIVSGVVCILFIILFLWSFRRPKKSPFYDIGRTPEAADYLALQLERLMALPLTTPAEIERWHQECNGVQQTLQREFPKFEPAHELWHFFADTDIRARDGAYRDYQRHLMSEYVHHLRNEKGRC